MELPLDDIRELLHSVELRVTPCRVAVLRYLQGESAPVSHAEVAEHLAAAAFDKSTVYRCLVEMAEAGVLARLDVGDHTWRFELRQTQADAEPEPDHPHFMCDDCGRIICLPDVQVNLGRPGSGALSDVGSIEETLLKGRCKACD